MRAVDNFIPEVHKSLINRFIEKVGWLRFGLTLLTLFLILMAPMSLGETMMSGWGMVPTMIAPALAPMLLFVYPLDMTMSAIYRSGADQIQQARHSFIIKLDLILMVVLVIVWLPFFRTLLRPS
ncbi:MAG: hypothetical protein ACNYPI_01740 [Arenicellales bacterium WSBS_2016_MAG_OTU3]